MAALQHHYRHEGGHRFARRVSDYWQRRIRHEAALLEPALRRRFETGDPDWWRD